MVDRNQFYKILRNAVFYLTRNPPTDQAELISGYLNCLLEFGKLNFPLNLISNFLDLLSEPALVLLEKWPEETHQYIRPLSCPSGRYMLFPSLDILTLSYTFLHDSGCSPSSSPSFPICASAIGLFLRENRNGQKRSFPKSFGQVSHAHCVPICERCCLYLKPVLSLLLKSQPMSAGLVLCVRLAGGTNYLIEIT